MYEHNTVILTHTSRAAPAVAQTGSYLVNTRQGTDSVHSASYPDSVHTTEGTDSSPEPAGTDPAGHADTHTANVTQDIAPAYAAPGIDTAQAVVDTESADHTGGITGSADPTAVKAGACLATATVHGRMAQT